MSDDDWDADPFAPVRGIIFALWVLLLLLLGYGLVYFIHYLLKS